jgi:hypothetical protein
MKKKSPTKMDRALARICHACPACRTARRYPNSFSYKLVKGVESKFCPFCQAYERVYGHKAHEKGAR